MEAVNVLVHGALGRMGQEVVRAVPQDRELRLVGAVDAMADRNSLLLSDGTRIPLSTDLESTIRSTSPGVMVDFTQHSAVMAAARIATRHQVGLVIGTSGMSETELDEIDQLSRKHGVGAVVVPNFSLGAILMAYLARISGKFFDYAEIIEMHHEKKLDSPSGTALATARGMVEARGRDFICPKSQKETLPGARGAEFGGIALHSVRSPGYMAHQEVILGGPGQTLSIRHDQFSREGFMPGVMLAIKQAANSKGLTFGLESLLHLQEQDQP